jgi:hypothetical protein
MEEQLKAVQALEQSPEVDAKAKAAVVENVEVLTKEVARPEPRKEWLQLSGKGLVEAAQTCAKMAGPVVVAVKKVWDLFAV